MASVIEFVYNECVTTMTDPSITCPACKAEIKLTESLAAPLVEATRRQYEKQLAEQQTEIARRETLVRDQKAELDKAKEAIDDRVAEQLKGDRARIAAEEAKKAKMLLSADLESKAREVSELQEVLKQRDEKLAEAQNAQADLLRKQREFDDAKREIELTIEKRVEESLGEIRDMAKKEAEDQLKLKVAERDLTISSMQKQIEELKRRSEQGSQQLQGEVKEIELESILRAKFPTDAIEPVAKGEYGGDILHRIVGPLQQTCGSILWETKRTKNWSDGWLPKLRDDQRTAKADFAVLVSQVLPKNVDAFDCIDGVWVTSTRCAASVAIALRQTLIELAAARKAVDGQQTKMEMVYQYLTGPRFRLRVQAIVEKFSDMHEILERERKTMTKLWAKREEQIRCVVESTAGMYGDLQGIAGKSFEEIEGLTVRAIEPPDADKRRDVDYRAEAIV